MADKVVQLRNKDGDNLYPISVIPRDRILWEDTMEEVGEALVVPKAVWVGALGSRLNDNNASRILITNTASVQNSEYISYNNDGTLTVLKNGIYMLHATVRWQDSSWVSGNEVSFNIVAATTAADGDPSTAVGQWMKLNQTRASQEKTTILPITTNNIISVTTYSVNQSTLMQVTRGEIEVIYLGPINN